MSINGHLADITDLIVDSILTEQAELLYLDNNGSVFFEVENYKVELKYGLISFYVVLDGISLEVDQINNKFLNKILEKIINEQYG